MFRTSWKIDFIVEDVVIAKLLWSKLGESDRQINDAAGVVRMQGEKLDLLYIESWVNSLGLGEQWRAARERAR